MTWRECYAPQIAKIIEDNKGKEVKVIKKILSTSNPGYYGHMKKIWSDESLKQLGLKKRKFVGRGKNAVFNNPNQESLF